jgi:hypothetical protein
MLLRTCQIQFKNVASGKVALRLIYEHLVLIKCFWLETRYCT